MEIAATDAKAQLYELLRRAQNGETIIVTNRGEPIAQITKVKK